MLTRMCVSADGRVRQLRSLHLIVLCALMYLVYGFSTVRKPWSLSAAETGLSARAILSKKATLKEHVQQQCPHLHDTYEQLLNPLLQYWNESGFDVTLLEHTSGDRIYVSNGKVSLSDSTAWARTIPTFVRYVEHIARLASLPDMVLPLNPADEPLAALKDGEAPRPLLAFCKIPGFSDVLIPNTAEGIALA